MSVQSYRWGFFFRLRGGGWGLAVQRDLPVRFSERYGHRKRVRLGRWCLSLLRSRPGLPSRPVCADCGQLLGEPHCGTCGHSLMHGGTGVVLTRHVLDT